MDTNNQYHQPLCRPKHLTTMQTNPLCKPSTMHTNNQYANQSN